MGGNALESIADEISNSALQELGNIILANAITDISKQGLSINITPPIPVSGTFKLTHFQSRITIPFVLEDKCEFNVCLSLETSKSN